VSSARSSAVGRRQCAFEERVHPAADTAFGGRRPPVEPTVHRLDVVEAHGAAVAGVRT
jgi:hypothetical protein